MSTELRDLSLAPDFRQFLRRIEQMRTRQAIDPNEQTIRLTVRLTNIPDVDHLRAATGLAIDAMRFAARSFNDFSLRAARIHVETDRNNERDMFHSTQFIGRANNIYQDMREWATRFYDGVLDFQRGNAQDVGPIQLAADLGSANDRHGLELADIMANGFQNYDVNYVFFFRGVFAANRIHPTLAGHIGQPVAHAPPPVQHVPPPVIAHQPPPNVFDLPGPFLGPPAAVALPPVRIRGNRLQIQGRVVRQPRLPRQLPGFLNLHNLRQPVAPQMIPRWQRFAPPVLRQLRPRPGQPPRIVANWRPRRNRRRRRRRR